MKKIFLVFAVVCCAVMVSANGCFWDKDSEDSAEYAICNQSGGDSLTNITVRNESYPDVISGTCGPWRETDTGTAAVSYVTNGTPYSDYINVEEGKFKLNFYGGINWTVDEF
ncbi:MAG TPA: hypothetical protein PK544_06020 [Spirochaetota bacterium]|nr:hypothetical protein [Spirochaetota bacterium]HPJ38109.1 hypothetical protein [Spirochaetota bacterium]HPQ51613.1 hypothetical protein [Spirochaetota bacterium]